MNVGWYRLATGQASVEHVDPTALPTDNLYKFMALAGLALAGFCGLLIWKLHDEWWPVAVDSFRKFIELGGPDAQAIDALKAKLSGANTVGRFKQVARRTLIFRIGIAVGLATSIAGFALWYYRLQWYADVQTKADFEDHMAELAAKRAARAKAAH